MLHALLRGDSLLDSVHRNLMTKQQADKFFGKELLGQAGLGDDAATTDRRPRRAQREPDLPGSARAAVARDLARGRSVVAHPRQWAGVCILSRLARAFGHDCHARGQRAARATARPGVLEKAAWRELHALTVKAGARTALAVQPLCRTFPTRKRSISGWGAWSPDKAKPVDTTESVLHVPAAMLGEPSQSGLRKGRAARGADVRFGSCGPSRFIIGSWETTWTDPK